MTYSDEFFTPEEVDQQIERVSQRKEGEPLDTEALAFLRSFYRQDSQQEQEALDRIWGRITRATTTSHKKEKGKVIPMHDSQLTYNNVASWRSRHVWQRLGTLAAVLFIVALVGGMAIVFNAARHSNTTSGSNGKSGSGGMQNVAQTPTPGPIHPTGQIGKIVYSTKVSMMDGMDAYGLSWSPASNRIGEATLSARSWDATTGKNVVNYGPQRYGSVFSVVWSPDGKRVAIVAVGQGVQIYNAATGKLLDTYPANGQASLSMKTGAAMLSGGSGAYATAWSPDGTLMATGFFGSYGNSVQVWNTTTNKLVLNYTGNADVVGSVAWSPDGKYIVSSSYDGSTQVWNASTGHKIADFEAHQREPGQAAWSPDGKTIAYITGDQVNVVNPFTGKVLMTHNGPNDKYGLTDLTWAPDGKSIASAGDHIQLWAVATGKTYYTFTKNPFSIRVLTWSPDGKYIVSTDSPETSTSTIQVWLAK
ncbi:MAG: WD40 repeat domain-containing protein [Ktedonobacteraceae bacterium]